MHSSLLLTVYLHFAYMWKYRHFTCQYMQFSNSFYICFIHKCVCVHVLLCVLDCGCSHAEAFCLWCWLYVLALPPNFSLMNSELLQGHFPQLNSRTILPTAFFWWIMHWIEAGVYVSGVFLPSFLYLGSVFTRLDTVWAQLSVAAQHPVDRNHCDTHVEELLHHRNNIHFKCVCRGWRLGVIVGENSN